MTSATTEVAAPTLLERPTAPTSPPRARRQLKAAVVVLLCTATSTVAVLRHLGTKPLWRDEAISLSVAARPVGRILSVLPRHDANAGLYYVMLHFWLRFGSGAAWARGFSAACLIATSAVAAWAGYRWRGSDTALACGLLVAVNPFLLYYGQEARPYALAVLLATVATVALFWPAPRVFVAAAIALLYADLFAVLYIAALVGTIAFAHWRRHEPPPTTLIRGTAVVGAVAAPLAVVMLFFERGQISWLPRPNAKALATTITAMTSGGLGLVLVFGLAAAALLAGMRARKVAVPLLAAFVLPPLALWTVAQVAPSFIDRYVICSTVAVVGLAAAGLASIRDRLGAPGRWVGLVILAALVVLGGQRSAHVEAEPFKVDNAPAVVAFIRAGAQPGDAVVYAGGGLRALMEATFSQGRAGDFPPDIALAPGGEAFLQHDLYAREVSPAVLVTRLVAVQRLWLITDPTDQRYPHGGPFASLRPQVTAAFGSAATNSFGAIEVTLLRRR